MKRPDRFVWTSANIVAEAPNRGVWIALASLLSHATSFFRICGSRMSSPFRSADVVDFRVMGPAAKAAATRGPQNHGGIVQATGARSRRQVVSRLRLHRHGNSVKSVGVGAFSTPAWFTNIARRAGSPCWSAGRSRDGLESSTRKLRERVIRIRWPSS